MKIFFPIAIVFCFINLEKTDLYSQDSDLPSDSVYKEFIMDKIEVNAGRVDLSVDELGFYKSSNLNSTEDILSRFNGISFIRRGNYAPEPVIRGLNTNQIDVTINGMKVMPACTDKMDPVTSYVETENLGSIDIDYGEGTGIFLNNLGGRIDLGLQSQKFSKKFLFSGDLKSGFQSSSDNYKGSIVLNFTDKNYGLNINGTYNNSGDYRTGSGEIIKNSGYKKYNISLNGSYKLNDNVLFKLNGILDDAYDIGYPALLMDVGSAKSRIIGADLFGKKLFDMFNDVNFKIYYNKVDHIMDDSKRNNGFRMDMPGRTKTFGSSLSGKVFLSKSASLVSGIEYSNSFSSADMTMYFGNGIPMYMVTWPDVRSNKATIKLSLKNSVSRNFNVIPFSGYGYQNSEIENQTGYNSLEIFYPGLPVSSDRNFFSGGIQSIYKFSSPLIADLSVLYSERFPTVSEEFGFYLYNRYDNYDYIGNPHLENENSIQLNLGLQYSEEKYSLKINTFGYFFGDYVMGVIDSSVSSMTPGSYGTKFYENIGRAFLGGVELNAMFKFSKYFSFIPVISYTYGTESNGDPLPLIPPLNSVLSLRYAYKNFYIQLEEVLNAPQNRVSNRSLENPTAGYVLTNIRSQYKFTDWISLSAGVENLFDKKYYNHLDWLEIPQEGVNFYADLKINY